MLKIFAHCWLILSLLVAPLQFAAADMAVLDHVGQKCEMMADMTGQHEMQVGDMAGMNHDMAKDGCDCPEQCKAQCASAHLSLGLNSVIQFAKVVSSYTVSALTTSFHGIDRLTELRPPKA